MSELIQLLESIAIEPTDIPPTGHIPFTYAIVFNNDDFYIGCKYSNSRDNGVAHPSILLTEEYNSSCSVVQDRVNEPHRRFILAIGDKYGVTKLEKDIVLQLWDVDGRLNNKLPMGVPAPIPTEETKAKLSTAHTGKTLTAEHRKRIGDANRGRKGKPMTPEHIKILSAANTARAAKRWPQERKDKLIGLRAAGKSFIYIGKIMGMHPGVAREMYIKFVPVEDRYVRNWPQERIDQLIELRDVEGLSFWRIGKIMGAGIDTVKRKYHRHKK